MATVPGNIATTGIQGTPYGIHSSTTAFEIGNAESRTFNIYIKTLNGRAYRLDVNSRTIVRNLKQQIQHRHGSPPNQQRLVFDLILLNDYCTLGSYGITPESVIYLVFFVPGEPQVLSLPMEFRDPVFDYDFSDLNDGGMVFSRGGENYTRPCGWMRYALAVKGRYDDDGWLGAIGMRSGSSPGEWAVAYHGTSKENAESIATSGFDLSKGVHFYFGYGIYASPDIESARSYATEFERDGKRYVIVVQTRVNPRTLQKVRNANKLKGEYWLIPNDKDIRPYGILVKKTSH